MRPSSEQKRAAILESALRTFAEFGYHDTDVQLICTNAGVGKATAYRHFKSKEQLFLATSRYCLEQLSEFVGERMPSEAESAELSIHELLLRIGIACAEFYQQCPQAVEMMLQERAEFRDRVSPTHLVFRAETRSGVDTMMQTAIETGEFRPTDVIEATNAYCDQLFGSIVNGCLEGKTSGLVRRVRAAITVLLDGFLQQSD